MTLLLPAGIFLPEAMDTVIAPAPVLRRQASTLADPFTAEDYRRMEDDGKRYQVINGSLIMAPSPRWNHQQLLRRLVKALEMHLSATDQGELCFSPFDVFFDEENILQPDIFFIAKERLHIVTEEGVMGAPDLVVEVLSPSTAKQDLEEKRAIYQQNAVREMWFLSPTRRAVEVQRLTTPAIGTTPAQYGPLERLPDDGTLTSPLLPGFQLPLAQLFRQLS